MITKLTSVFGTKHDREMKRLRPFVESINALEAEISNLTDQQLQQKRLISKKSWRREQVLMTLCRKRLQFVVRQAKRVLKMRHYDVQMIEGWFFIEVQ